MAEWDIDKINSLRERWLLRITYIDKWSFFEELSEKDNSVFIYHTT